LNFLERNCGIKWFLTLKNGAQHPLPARPNARHRSFAAQGAGLWHTLATGLDLKNIYPGMGAVQIHRLSIRKTIGARCNGTVKKHICPTPI
jgi:hypothetical protein